MDRAKAFYAEQAGFIVDHDHTVTEDLRCVQLTPPGPSSPGGVWRWSLRDTSG